MHMSFNLNTPMITLRTTIVHMILASAILLAACSKEQDTSVPNKKKECREPGGKRARDMNRVKDFPPLASGFFAFPG